MARAKFRVWCVTEQGYEITDFIESTEPPTECPIDPEHVIDEEKTAIVEWEP